MSGFGARFRIIQTTESRGGSTDEVCFVATENAYVHVGTLPSLKLGLCRLKKSYVEKSQFCFSILGTNFPTFFT